jgi:hypothetical protein
VCGSDAACSLAAFGRRAEADYAHGSPPRLGESQISLALCVEATEARSERTDLFRCESLILKTHWVMVAMDQFTRRIIGFAVRWDLKPLESKWPRAPNDLFLPLLHRNDQ